MHLVNLALHQIANIFCTVNLNRYYSRGNGNAKKIDQSAATRSSHASWHTFIGTERGVLVLAYN